jgi:hypothetical protein
MVGTQGGIWKEYLPNVCATVSRHSAWAWLASYGNRKSVRFSWEWITVTEHYTNELILIRGCIQKFPDWVDHEVQAYNNKHSLRSKSGRGWEFFSSPPHPDRLWAHPATYPMCTKSSFPEGKAAGACSWPLTSI